MAAEKRRPDDFFTLRLWCEEGVRDRQWRAIITHVASGERCLFANYGELCEFLDRWKRRSLE
jgi:hypothetical protein